jgi:hypothetical protein
MGVLWSDQWTDWTMIAYVCLEAALMALGGSQYRLMYVCRAIQLVGCLSMLELDLHDTSPAIVVTSSVILSSSFLTISDVVKSIRSSVWQHSQLPSMYIIRQKPAGGTGCV